MVFYKVVRRRDKTNKDLTSVTTNGFSIKYKTQRWRKPRLQGSKIFVFDSLNNARCFIAKNSGFNLVIYECEVQNPVKAQCYAYIADDNSILYFWRRGLEEDKSDFQLPVGTYFVDKVKLIKRVK
jgi:hypothetical protein